MPLISFKASKMFPFLYSIKMFEFIWLLKEHLDEHSRWNLQGPF